ncbi:MAG TPA: alpha/beta hydrolase [Archangium sp.]|uniref:alpha/beta fold hydrolase n=1 Tax=Archangium sp. TaxID=1872627 RepID=UPI002E309180|nr:alpha/beta hydrolase [Archangium sp.]HEX5747719.1 alpha/beta hydrolase [Archangium sp.]
MQHAYANINGIRMHYVMEGKGEPILFLHGCPEYWGVWKRYLAEFSKDHLVIAPDLRGYNQTTRPNEVEQYGINLLVEDVRALLEHLGLREVTVVSQDWGALLGWSFALRYPECVRRFITANITHPALFNRELRENPRQQEASRYMLTFSIPGIGAQLAANDFAFMRQSVIEDARKGGAQLSDEDVEEWVRTWGAPGAIEAILNYYRAARLGPPDGKGYPGGSNLLEGVPQERWKVNFPVLMLWGDADRALLSDCLNGLEEYVPDLTLHKFPGATHWVTLQRSAQVIPYIREFMARKG